MKIQKFFHSCLLIEKEGQKLLIDPGEFCFIEGLLKPEDIPAPDVLLLTHEHSDHFYPEVFPKIFSSRGGSPPEADGPRAHASGGKDKKPQIITHERLHDLLKEKGYESTVIKAGSTIAAHAFTITGIKAPHGLLPVPAPENICFLINNKIVHPGDSLTFSLNQPIEVLALPITAPWLTLKDTVETAIRIKPKIVIPIHDAIMKDFMLQRMYNVAQKRFSEAGIEFKPLKLGEVLEIAD